MSLQSSESKTKMVVSGVEVSNAPCCCLFSLSFLAMFGNDVNILLVLCHFGVMDKREAGQLRANSKRAKTVNKSFKAGWLETA